MTEMHVKNECVCVQVYLKNLNTRLDQTAKLQAQAHCIMVFIIEYDWRIVHKRNPCNISTGH